MNNCKFNTGNISTIGKLNNWKSWSAYQQNFNIRAQVRPLSTLWSRSQKVWKNGVLGCQQSCYHQSTQIRSMVKLPGATSPSISEQEAMDLLRSLLSDTGPTGKKPTKISGSGRSKKKSNNDNKSQGPVLLQKSDINSGNDTTDVNSNLDDGNTVLDANVIASSDASQLLDDTSSQTMTTAAGPRKTSASKSKKSKVQPSSTSNSDDSTPAYGTTTDSEQPTTPTPPPLSESQLKQFCRQRGIFYVRSNLQDAKHALNILLQNGGESQIHAWDTESTDINLRRLKNPHNALQDGQMVVASCYISEDVDFWREDSDGDDTNTNQDLPQIRCPCLFLDNRDSKAINGNTNLTGTSHPNYHSSIIRTVFKDYFENPHYKKIFHNYSYDYKVFKREGISMKGFFADTLHLARLQDTSLGNWEAMVTIHDEEAQNRKREEMETMNQLSKQQYDEMNYDGRDKNEVVEEDNHRIESLGDTQTQTTTAVTSPVTMSFGNSVNPKANRLKNDNTNFDLGLIVKQQSQISTETQTETIPVNQTDSDPDSSQNQAQYQGLEASSKLSDDFHFAGVHEDGGAIWEEEKAKQKLKEEQKKLMEHLRSQSQNQNDTSKTQTAESALEQLHQEQQQFLLSPDELNREVAQTMYKLKEYWKREIKDNVNNSDSNRSESQGPVKINDSLADSAPAALENLIGHLSRVTKADLLRSAQRKIMDESFSSQRYNNYNNYGQNPNSSSIHPDSKSRLEQTISDRLEFLKVLEKLHQCDKLPSVREFQKLFALLKRECDTQTRTNTREFDKTKKRLTSEVRTLEKELARAQKSLENEKEKENKEKTRLQKLEQKEKDRIKKEEKKIEREILKSSEAGVSKSSTKNQTSKDSSDNLDKIIKNSKTVKSLGFTVDSESGNIISPSIQELADLESEFNAAKEYFDQMNEEFNDVNLKFLRKALEEGYITVIGEGNDSNSNSETSTTVTGQGKSSDEILSSNFNHEKNDLLLTLLHGPWKNDDSSLSIDEEIHVYPPHVQDPKKKGRPKSLDKYIQQQDEEQQIQDKQIESGEGDGPVLTIRGLGLDPIDFTPKTGMPSVKLSTITTLESILYEKLTKMQNDGRVKQGSKKMKEIEKQYEVIQSLLIAREKRDLVKQGRVSIDKIKKKWEWGKRIWERVDQQGNSGDSDESNNSQYYDTNFKEAEVNATTVLTSSDINDNSSVTQTSTYEADQNQSQTEDFNPGTLATATLPILSLSDKSIEFDNQVLAIKRKLAEIQEQIIEDTALVSIKTEDLQEKQEELEKFFKENSVFSESTDDNGTILGQLPRPPQVDLKSVFDAQSQQQATIQFQTDSDDDSEASTTTSTSTSTAILDEQLAALQKAFTECNTPHLLNYPDYSPPPVVRKDILLNLSAFQITELVHHCNIQAQKIRIESKLRKSAKSGRGGYGLKNLVRVFGIEQSPRMLQSLLDVVPKTIPMENRVDWLHRSDERGNSSLFLDWSEYACMDSKHTKLLYLKLREDLSEQDWDTEVPVPLPNDYNQIKIQNQNNHNSAAQQQNMMSMWHFYESFYRPFGELLNEMELRGCPVCLNHLENIEKRAHKDAYSTRLELFERIRNWFRIKGVERRIGELEKELEKFYESDNANEQESLSSDDPDLYESHNDNVIRSNLTEEERLKYNAIVTELNDLDPLMDRLEWWSRVCFNEKYTTTSNDQNDSDDDSFDSEESEYKPFTRSELANLDKKFEVPQPERMNLASSQQVRQLLYGPWQPQPSVSQQQYQNSNSWQQQQQQQLQQSLNLTGKSASQLNNINSIPSESDFDDPLYNANDNEQLTPKFRIKGLSLIPDPTSGISNTSNLPKTSREALEELKSSLDVDDCRRGILEAFVSTKHSSSMLNYFISPLLNLAKKNEKQYCGNKEQDQDQDQDIKQNHRLSLSKDINSEDDYIPPRISRVHPSLVLDTATGRLACRAPNLQNQPALERDLYKIRKSIRAKKDECLIVCDFGQLELRVLAHETRCQSMIRYFREGGDFHSRTAIDMNPDLQQQIDNGQLQPSDIKSLFPDKRKEAKTINFGIAYGRQAFSIAQELNITKNQAEDLIERWFEPKREVKQ